VKILNGEIVADDDPRLPKATPKNGPTPKGTEKKPPVNQNLHMAQENGGAPPPDNAAPQQRGLLGLPHVTVFDVPLKPEMYLAALALCIFGGSTGMMGVILAFFGYRHHFRQQQRQGANRQGPR